uniref:Uncharacterized protein n=1 Tax=Arundo donax TaxID=35708 RepID=A0A0A9G2A2_ARUDO
MDPVVKFSFFLCFCQTINYGFHVSLSYIFLQLFWTLELIVKYNFMSSLADVHISLHIISLTNYKVPGINYSYYSQQ